MPVRTSRTWPNDKHLLFQLGQERVEKFCTLNNIPIPVITNTTSDNWYVDACAYYRPDTEGTRKYTTPGINICLERCGYPCTQSPSRNWSWPASITDRTPYGVLAHELGHHCDWLTGVRKGSYFSEYCEEVMHLAQEPAITSYAPNPAEWLAEMFRLFTTNPDLLKHLRPKTHALLLHKWKPMGKLDWRVVLGSNVPPKVIKTLQNKGAK